MTQAARAWVALGALGAIAAITASWWALALWPVGPLAPDWLLRTREVCFGSTTDRLPNAGGWLLLLGQPAGMLGVLIAVWGTELRDGLARATRRVAGQVAVGMASAALLAGIGGVVVRVTSAGQIAFATGAREAASELTRVNDAAPALALIDQHGRDVTLELLRGRPVIVTFAYAHCETVCPLIVADVLAARRTLGADAPPVLIVTLDPWRDTPSRLPSMAKQWQVPANVHVLSGAPDAVEHVLNRWRVPRVRNQKTGDISHPSIVYVVGPSGRITYALHGGAQAIATAVRRL